MVRRIAAGIALLAAAFALVVGGCAGGTKRDPDGGAAASAPAEAVTVLMQDIRYDKTSLSATRGQPIVITLKNGGTVDHDFTIARIERERALVGGGDPSGGRHEFAVHVYLLSNAEAKLELTPSTAGTYEYYCTLPGHTEVGMKGVLVVR